MENQFHKKPVRNGKAQLPASAAHADAQEQKASRYLADHRPATIAQLKSKVNINDDKALENEADAMGAKALQMKGASPSVKQRSSAPLKSAPVQRFKSVDASGYELEKDEDNESFFTTQSKDLRLKKTRNKKNYRIRHKMSRTDEKQNINVSEDGTMGINNTQGEAKEFYATGDVVKSSNEELEAGKSLIKLLKGSGIRMNLGDKVLYKVLPARADDSEQEESEGFADLISFICIEMASNIMGDASSKKHEVVFQKPGGKKQVTADITSPDDQPEDSIGRLAERIASAPTGTEPEKYRESMYRETKTDAPGISYGRKSGKGELNAKEKKLGVNKYARPDVGEGFATFSIPVKDKKSIDYTTNKKGVERFGHVWGYHFAGVVAKSADGQDTITLENYNRSSMMYKQLGQLLDKLINENKGKLNAVLEEVQPKPGDTRTQTDAKMLKVFEVINNSTTSQARDKYTSLVDSFKPEKSWFFAMQGPRKGQSFHEQQAASETFVNPLTLRVRKRDEGVANRRNVCTQKVMNCPDPPDWLYQCKEYEKLEDIKSNQVKRITEALPQAIETTGGDALETMINYLLSTAAKVSVRLALAQGAEVDPTAADGLGAEQGVDETYSASREVASGCHEELENKIQSLWITQVAEKMDMVKTSFQVFEAYGYMETVHSYYDGL